MSDRYPIPIGEARCELLVLNSRFLATAAPARTPEAARALIARARAELPEANHHCYAFLAGYGASVTAGMSDDGEPSGTAGRPMLAVLRGSGLGDICVVVTRFFGGTLLGTGGLVRAYSDAVREVLAIVPRGEYVELSYLQIVIGYAEYAAARRLLETFQATIQHETFATDVELIVELPRSLRDSCQAALINFSHGAALVEPYELPVESSE